MVWISGTWASNESAKAGSMTTTSEHLPVCNITEPAAWSGLWWLLDVETSGLNRQEDDIIALRLACMEDFSITEEREILIRPRQPLSP